MKYIAYYRVSTHKQGLGLEAQQATVTAHIKTKNGVLLSEYQEKESGKDTIHRQELQKALAEAKRNKCVLIVAKLDRLSRDVADIFTLTKSYQIEVCNMDASDTMMLGIMASLAQKERELISTRTKEALAAKKAQGVKLGNPKYIKELGGNPEAFKEIQEKSAKAKSEKAKNDPEQLKAYAIIKNESGTLRDKAAYLNKLGVLTPKGGQWTAMQVSRLINKFATNV